MHRDTKLICTITTLFEFYTVNNTIDRIGLTHTCMSIKIYILFDFSVNILTEKDIQRSFDTFYLVHDLRSRFRVKYRY